MKCLVYINAGFRLVDILALMKKLILLLISEAQLTDNLAKYGKIL